MSHSISARDTANRSVNRSANSSQNTFPPCIIDGCAVSRTFQVLYKNERVDLDDVITYRTYLNLDVSRCVEQVSTTDFILTVELWFTEQDFPPTSISSLECVSSRDLLMHVDLCKGLHYHRPVLFDYFHLSAICISIHTGLTSFGKPFSGNKSIRPNDSDIIPISYVPCGYDLLVFDCTLDTINAMDWSQMQLRLRRAQLIHWQLCSILFAHLSTLNDLYNEYKELSSSKRSCSSRSLLTSSSSSSPSVHVNGTNIVPSNRSLSNLAQVCYQCSLENMKTDFDLTTCHRDLSVHQKNSDSPLRPVNQYRPIEYLTMIESDLTYLSTLCRLQYEQFLTLTIGNRAITRHLAQIHHINRISRFTESFFIINKSTDDIESNMDNICDKFNQTSDTLRRSAYFQLLPKCHVECKSLDGESNSLPIIYQEIFNVNYKSNQLTSTLPSIEDSFAKLLSNNSRHVTCSSSSNSIFPPIDCSKSSETATTSLDKSEIKSSAIEEEKKKNVDKSSDVHSQVNSSRQVVDDDKVKVNDDQVSISSKRSLLINTNSIAFIDAKEEFRHNLPENWKIFSDLEWQTSAIPYFEIEDEGYKSFTLPQHHLIICVHGLDGNSADLRMVRTFLELALPSCDLVFLMSQRNQGETFDCLDVLTERLAKEIINHIQTYRLRPAKVRYVIIILFFLLSLSFLRVCVLVSLVCKLSFQLLNDFTDARSMCVILDTTQRHYCILDKCATKYVYNVHLSSLFLLSFASLLYVNCCRRRLTVLT